jgi:16S rRNA (cytosine967-C5)-methyltransferase
LRAQDSLRLALFEADAVEALAVHYSHPAWMVRRWLNRFGLQETKRLCAFNNRRPAISVRVNVSKTRREELLKEFENAEITVNPSSYFLDFIKIEQPGDVTQ